MKATASARSSLLVLTALGVVFGDIGTSPLYALRECFHGSHSIELSTPHIFGVLSLILWSLIMVVSVKYLQFVTHADNEGEGGVLALTALACLSRRFRYRPGNNIFLTLGLFGAALLVGDGMITPSISVLSAIEGLSIATPVFDSWVLPLTLISLTGLFAVQQFGTKKIGGFFGPVMILWFFLLAVLGVFSILETPEILTAASPHYAILFIMQEPELAFIVLGSVFLVATGGEALYADMGHFGRIPITRAWYGIALPALTLNYFGQGALLLRSPEAVSNPFYKLVPENMIIAVVILATAATIIASQAMISGLFSLARQCVQLGYCPRLVIKHTSESDIGQIYVPAVNWLTLIGTLWLVIEFKSSGNLASAYGIAVSTTMVITTILATLVAIRRWRWKTTKLIILIGTLIIFDLAFFSANLLKIADGGWVPLVIAAGVFILMTTWYRGRQLLSQTLRKRSYPIEKLLEEIQANPPQKVPGTAIFMVGDPETTPPAFVHNLQHNKVIHENVVFLTVVTENRARVQNKDRAEIKVLAPGIYRLTAHFGFNDTPNVIKFLEHCHDLDPNLKIEDPAFFLGREILVTGSDKQMSFWRKSIFSFLSKNSSRANSYFALPIDRVFEVGMQVEI